MADGRLVTRSLLACGAVGPPLFVLVFLVDGASRSGYDPAYHPVSALSLGERGWLQITNFVVTGLLLLGFAAGVRRALRTGRGATWGPPLIGVYALSLLLSGPFVMDPMRGYPPGTPPGPGGEPSWHHTLHDVFGTVVFLSLPVACFVLAGWFATRPARRGWTWYSVATRFAGLGLLVAFSAAWEADYRGTGLLQRVMIVVGWTWVTLLALRLRADTTQRARTRPDHCIGRRADRGMTVRRVRRRTAIRQCFLSVDC
jgi:hypothetical membrane protein